MRPRTLLLLLSGVLVLTETRAGECGVWKERPLRGGARGPPGSLGAGPQGESDPTPLPRAAPSPRSRPVPPLHPDPSFLPPPEFGPVFYRFHLTGPTPPPASRSPHLGPGTRAGRRSGRVSPLPAPRLPLPEVFQHRRVPARPRGAQLHRRRLRGPHAVRAVRQRRPESEDGAAGAVDGAGGEGSGQSPRSLVDEPLRISRSRAVSGAGTLHVGDSPSPRVSLSLSQPVSSPPA